MRPFLTISIILGALIFCLKGWSEDIRVSVTIPPIKALVERIGGDLVSVRAMQGPGDSCEVFEPRPQSVAWLAKSSLYFSVDIGSEIVLLQNHENRFPQLKVISLVNDVDDHRDHQHHDNSSHHNHPHQWLVPENFAKMAQQIADELILINPEREEAIRIRLNQILIEIAQLNTDLIEMLKPIKGMSFLVLHPSFGAFADAYELKELAISQNAFNFQTKAFQQTVSEARKRNVRAVLVQPQESRKQADQLASVLKISVIEVNALDENWFIQMHKIGQSLANSHLNRGLNE